MTVFHLNVAEKNQVPKQRVEKIRYFLSLVDATRSSALPFRVFFSTVLLLLIFNTYANLFPLSFSRMHISLSYYSFLFKHYHRHRRRRSQRLSIQNIAIRILRILYSYVSAVVLDKANCCFLIYVLVFRRDCLTD